MSINTIESLLSSCQSQCRAEMLARESQGDIPRKKDDVGRLQRRVRTFKGSLTSAITNFNGHVEHYKRKYPTDDEEGPVGPDKIDCANSVLKSEA